MPKVLVCWVGNTDRRAAAEPEAVWLGPIAQAVEAGSYDEVSLLSDHPEERLVPYLAWLRGRSPAPIVVHRAPLSSPTHFGEIYEACVRALANVRRRHGAGARLSFHLSPGTPAMAAAWILLAKTRSPAELIESSPQQGVRTASLPFDISADFLPDLLRAPDRELERLSAGLPPEALEFEFGNLVILEQDRLRLRRQGLGSP